MMKRQAVEMHGGKLLHEPPRTLERTAVRPIRVLKGDDAHLPVVDGNTRSTQFVRSLTNIPLRTGSLIPKKKVIHTGAAGAFHHGQIPVIACFDHSEMLTDAAFDKLIRVLQVYVDRHVAPAWGTPARLVKSKGFVKGAWALAFLDDVDRPGVMAYHDLTPEGMPMSKVFVRTAEKNGELVSVMASHELVEMLVDPGTNIAVLGPDGESFYYYETADPVEETFFKVSGVPMSNFVYPAYFESFRKRGSAQFDHMGLVKKPFQILPGGYQHVFKDGGWRVLHGSPEKESRRNTQNRGGRRGERRRKLKTGLERADRTQVKREEKRLASRKKPVVVTRKKS